MSKMLERTLQLMQSKREETAAELLAWEKIEAAIRTAAGAGLDRATIPTPIRLRHTAAAVAAIERLTRERFRTRWDDRPTPTGPAGDQLEIEWTAASA